MTGPRHKRRNHYTIVAAPLRIRTHCDIHTKVTASTSTATSRLQCNWVDSVRREGVDGSGCGLGAGGGPDSGSWSHDITFTVIVLDSGGRVVLHFPTGGSN